ncbi:MAG TPA: OmpH family outer membrane protein [Planctomycetes bacterium]|nr:OmpH family outer membrane protein [Planctomycetota bacterium]HIK82360.1 OmpH family outer membrane protein [Planctomycetota bacterium]
MKPVDQPIKSTRYQDLIRSVCLVLVTITCMLSLQQGLSGSGVELESHRVGVCDVQVVLDQIPQGKEITNEFSQLRRKMEEDVRNQETSLRRIQQEASQLQPGTDARREAEKRFTLAKAELTWMQEDLEQEFTSRFKLRRDDLIKIVRDAIQEVANERELDLVLNNVARAAEFKVYVSVWARKDLDITMEVISKVASRVEDR